MRSIEIATGHPRKRLLAECAKASVTPKRRGRGKARPRESGLAGLRSSDKRMLDFLNSLCRVLNDPDNMTPPVGIHTIAEHCGISPRQVQISRKRLVEAGIIKRMGHDSGHPDLTKRGTIYKVLHEQSNGDFSIAASEAARR